MNWGKCAALAAEATIQAADLAELRDAELARAAAANRSGEPLAAQAFAMAAEASRRVNGELPAAGRLTTAVALQAGITTEGDVVLAAVAGALAGRVVHVLADTEDVARQHADRIRPLGTVLGLGTGFVSSDVDKAGNEATYLADITCGRADDIGYDYLRDQLALDRADLVQRGLDHAIVSGAANNLTQYVITAPIGESTRTIARITAYGLFRRYRTIVGVGEPVSDPAAIAYEDVWDAQIREFHERRRAVLLGDDFAEFGGLVGTPAYERRLEQLTAESGLGLDIIPKVQRTVLLVTYDALWRDQLASMGRLRERALAHPDPLAEFREASTLYRSMWDAITRRAVDGFFSVEITR
jgi:preprotein translocase subunit SecA